MKWLQALPTLVITCYLAACSSPQFQPESKVVITPVLSDKHIVMPDGYELPYSLRLPESEAKAIVIALHGFNDYRKAFDSMCDYLVDSQIACLAYDQRGFGETDWRGYWPGEGVLQRDLKEVITLIRARYDSLPVVLAGESMGGAVILSALKSDHEFWTAHTEGTVLFAPAVWARSTQPWYQRLALWLAVHSVPGWKPTGASLEIVPTNNIEALRAMSRDQNVIKETRIDAVYGLTNLMDDALNAADKQTLQPLILYGEKDEVIPKKPTCEMLDRMQAVNEKVNVILYPDGYHMLTRDLQAEVVFADVVGWITGQKDRFGDSELTNFCIGS